MHQLVDTDNLISGNSFVGSSRQEGLVQVIVNLLSNAVKFSPKGSTIRVGVYELSDGIKISVEDEGPGIPEEHRQAVFDRFQQLDSNTTTEKGFGLRLNICKAIAEAHGGTLGVAAGANGKGCVFCFTIPNRA